MYIFDKLCKIGPNEIVSVISVEIKIWPGDEGLFLLDFQIYFYKARVNFTKTHGSKVVSANARIIIIEQRYIWWWQNKLVDRTGLSPKCICLARALLAVFLALSLLWLMFAPVSLIIVISTARGGFVMQNCHESGENVITFCLMSSELIIFLVPGRDISSWMARITCI